MLSWGEICVLHVKLGLDAKEFVCTTTLHFTSPTAFIQNQLDESQEEEGSNMYKHVQSNVTVPFIFTRLGKDFIGLVSYLILSTVSWVGYYYYSMNRKSDTLAKYHPQDSTSRARTWIQNHLTPKHRLTATTIPLHFNTNMGEVTTVV